MKKIAVKTKRKAKVIRTPVKKTTTPASILKAAKIARTSVRGKELVPIAIALAIVSIGALTPIVVGMARGFVAKRKEKMAAQRVTLRKAIAAAREAKNRITAAPEESAYAPHQLDKKVGAAARQKQLLKTSAVRAKTIRNADYTRTDHAVNRR
jgi:hypothetical protein